MKDGKPFTSLEKMDHPLWVDYIIWKSNGTLPYTGGMRDQPVRFVTFSHLALASESKASMKYIKKSSRNRSRNKVGTIRKPRRGRKR